MAPLVISEFLGLFVNTMTADDGYSLPNSENSRVLIQMQLSQKQKTFFRFLAELLKTTPNFQHVQNKMTPNF